MSPRLTRRTIIRMLNIDRPSSISNFDDGDGGTDGNGGIDVGCSVDDKADVVTLPGIT